MSLDVVKNKSNSKPFILALIHILASIIILSFNLDTLKSSKDFFDLKTTTPITVTSIEARNSKIYINYKATLIHPNKDLKETLPYFKLSASHSLPALESELKKSLKEAFVNSSDPDSIHIFKRFPFKKSIYLGLEIALYTLFWVYISSHHYRFNLQKILNSIVRKIQNISP